MAQSNITASAPAPRDIKHLAKVFLTAAEAIAEPKRSATCKAALQKIQADMKAEREKEKQAAARLKAKAAKVAKKPDAQPVAAKAPIKAKAAKKPKASTGKSRARAIIPPPAAPLENGLHSGD